MPTWHLLTTVHAAGGSKMKQAVDEGLRGVDPAVAVADVYVVVMGVVGKKTFVDKIEIDDPQTGYQARLFLL